MRFSYLGTKLSQYFCLFLFVALLGSAAFAQSGTTSLTGTVKDANGAVIPGATVKLSNSATGFERTTTSNDDGAYNFAGIPPATYQLEVTATNFKKLVNSSLVLAVDTSAKFDPILEAGNVAAIVNVTTSSIESIVNTQDGSIGNNINSEQITQLPTDLRRVNDLLALQPGVTRDGYVAGGRSDQANITLDGVDINDQQTGGRSGSFDTTQDSALRATTESVEEFRITTTGANANQGRSSGAQISLITKSGTNDLKGAIFYFKRPTFGSANNFFNNANGLERPSLSRDVYGGAIGGPIKKDKLFFFYSYEGQYQTQEQLVSTVVPLAHLGQGIIKFHGTGPSCVDGNCSVGLNELNNVIFPEAGINPLAVNVLADAAARYPSNGIGDGDGLNTGAYFFNAPTTVKENTHIVRLDWNVRDDQQIFFRGNFQWDNALETSRFPDTTATSTWSHPYGWVVGHNWTISNNMVNNFRWGLTRQAFSSSGDSAENDIFFRFVFAPLTASRTLSRVTPVHNFTDDFTWIRGNHTWQFGGNVRIIRNNRVTYANAYDFAFSNPSYYDLSGAVINRQFIQDPDNPLYTINGGDIASVQAAAAALIGRYSEYGANFTFDRDGSVLEPGTPAERSFATEEYDTYVQDIWKVRPSLTLTLGLRYALSRPVYEKNGFQVVPDTPLGEVFERRKASALQGVPDNELIQFVLGGPANNGPGFYKMDWNDFQPRVAAAWSPNFKGGWLGAIFGKNRESVFRGGFGISNDHFGGQLAVSFDGLSTIGFTSSNEISANTYNVTDRLAPLFTGFGQDIRSLPGIPPPEQRFSTPADEAQRIETSLDSTITSPINYSWNFSWGRQLPKGMYFEASYVGRMARHLFGTRDVMALNDLVDPQSGMDWYTAAGMLHDARANNTDINNLAAIPYFEHLFPGLGANFWGIGQWSSTQAVYQIVARQDFTGPYNVCTDDEGNFIPCDFYDILDWTYVQSLIDDYGINPNMFFHPQYAAFSAYGTFGKSNYHGATFSLRQRLGDTLSYDINYTFSKSMDDVSGLQTDGSYGNATSGGQFLLNPLRPQDSYAVSDFDTTHVINANFMFAMPIGRGRAWFSNMNRWADAFIGGWSLNGIYRWNTGRPLTLPFDQAQWATNWNAQSAGTMTRPIEYGVYRDTQNIFADPQAAFNSFRNARPGETGGRNQLRSPGYQTLDLGLSKSITMPWNEKQKFQFRWEVFNVTNVQYFAVTNLTRSSWGLPQDPEDRPAAGNFGNVFTDIQGTPRRMQFGFRYSF